MSAHPLARCCWCGAAFVEGEALGLRVWVCPTAACQARCLAHAMTVQLKKGQTTCRYLPLPRQVELFEALAGPATNILMGGARGGSKSRGLREVAHKLCLSTPHFRALLLRRTYQELVDNHFEKLDLEAPTMGAEFVPSAKVVRYPNGSTLRFGHCETAADVSHYLSSEFDLIEFDELVTFEHEQFLLISSSGRSTKPGVTSKVVCGTNPGGPQSHWVRQLFIDHVADREAYPDYDPADYVFIPSKLEDNPYLDASYEKKLLALPPELRKAYRDGDWDIFPGQYFPEWRRATHVSREHRVFPSEMPRYLSMDWGFVKPGSVGWWVLDDGHLYREDEYIFTRTTAFAVGQEIARRSKARGLTRFKYLVYDTAMEIPNNDSGESTIQTVRRGLRAGGVSIATIQADKDRLNGWQRLRHWLTLAPDGRPWLQSSPACPYFNRTLPSLVSDPHRAEDVDSDGEDHSADDARYLAMSCPMPGVETRTAPLPEWSLAWLKTKSRVAPGLLGARHAAR